MNFYLNKLKNLIINFFLNLLKYTNCETDYSFVKKTLKFDKSLFLFLFLLPIVFLSYTLIIIFIIFNFIFFIFIFLKNLFLVKFFNRDNLIISFSTYDDKTFFCRKYFINFFEKNKFFKTFLFLIEEVFIKMPRKKAFSIIYFTLKSLNKFINKKKNENKNIKQILLLIFAKFNIYVLNRIFFIITSIPFKVVFITCKFVNFYNEILKIGKGSKKTLISNVLLSFFANFYINNSDLVLVYDCKIIINKNEIKFNPFKK